MLCALLRHGLKRIVLLNGHGGNAPVIFETTLRIRHDSGLVIPCFYLWKIANRLLPGIVGPELAARSGGHGANPLASITWHLLPDLMRPDLIPEPPIPGPLGAGTLLGLPVSGFGTALFEGIEVDVPVEIDGIAPGGVAAVDASLCAPETGAALVEQLTGIGARFVAHVARQERQAP
jgi:creatinine amidohydrolase